MFGEEEGLWTREDIDELVSEIQDNKEYRKYKNMRIIGAYIENDKQIELDFEFQDEIFTIKQKIDMRKIKTFPSDLAKVYAPIMVELLENTINLEFDRRR